MVFKYVFYSAEYSFSELFPLLLKSFAFDGAPWLSTMVHFLVSKKQISMAQRERKGDRCTLRTGITFGVIPKVFFA